MYICICTGVTDSDIKRCVEQKGVEDIKGLKAELGACGQCGKCVPEARRILSACQVEKSFEKSGRKAA
jgi:bacterioferritin-associated ferredoxin